MDQNGTPLVLDQAQQTGIHPESLVATVPTSTVPGRAPAVPRAAMPTTVAQAPAGAVNMIHHRDEDHDDFYGDADEERRGGSNSCCLIGAILGVVLAFGVVAGVIIVVFACLGNSPSSSATTSTTIAQPISATAALVTPSSYGASIAPAATMSFLDPLTPTRMSDLPTDSTATAPAGTTAMQTPTLTPTIRDNFAVPNPPTTSILDWWGTYVLVEKNMQDEATAQAQREEMRKGLLKGVVKIGDVIPGENPGRPVPLWTFPVGPTKKTPFDLCHPSTVKIPAHSLEEFLGSLKLWPGDEIEIEGAWFDHDLKMFANTGEFTVLSLNLVSRGIAGMEIELNGDLGARVSSGNQPAFGSGCSPLVYQTHCNSRAQIDAWMDYGSDDPTVTPPHQNSVMFMRYFHDITVTWRGTVDWIDRTPIKMEKNPNVSVNMTFKNMMSILVKVIDKSKGVDLGVKLITATIPNELKRGDKVEFSTILKDSEGIASQWVQTQLVSTLYIN